MSPNLNIAIRRPSALPSTSEPETTTLTPPEIAFLSGTWHVTHSTLPMWKTKRNVAITYESLPPSSNGAQRLDDLVTYQSTSSDKLQTVRGVDTSVLGQGADGWAWHWRGSGWLMIASSKWEVLGYGEETEEQWAVTYFAKTLFTPAGLDIYSRSKKGLPEGLLGRIKDALKGIEDEGFQDLVSGLFEVQRDAE